jgi:Fe-S oxidoreductase
MERRVIYGDFFKKYCDYYEGEFSSTDGRDSFRWFSWRILATQRVQFCARDADHDWSFAGSYFCKLPKITFHDPCYYARFLDIYDQPREIIDALGVQCVDVRNSKKLTCCCGGPIESIAPGLSREVAMDRIQELQKTGCRIVAMCPICILNMRRVGAEVEDFSTVVAEAIQ